MAMIQHKAWWPRFKQTLKNHRNDWLLDRYLSCQASDLATFKTDLVRRVDQISGPKYLLCIVAFERAEVIDLCLSALRLHLRNVVIAVFDNSRSEKGRRLISAACASHQALYLALPQQPTQHANRSHGLAMTWIYQRILKELALDGFGFIDHDLIAMETVNPFASLGTQPVYGTLNQGDQAWNLWAGYCFFRSDYLAGKAVNFLYDFSRELDTGGRNWGELYATLQANQIQFAKDQVTTQNWMGEVSHPVQLIDDCWLHVGGVSYNDNLSNKQALFQALVDYIHRLKNRS